MIGILLLAAALLFVAGMIASTSQMLFVAIAWSLMGLCLLGALLVWLISQLRRHS
jgi:hypothetical protein